MRRTRWLWLIVVALTVAGACSESEPLDEAPVADDTRDTGGDEGDDTRDTGGDEGNDTRDTGGDEGNDTGDTGANPDSEFIVERHGGETWFMGTVPSAPVAADPSLEPIRIGMINQEDTPAGSFPELRFAVDAAINWINAELGGVGGRPLELVPCITQFSVEGSQACAQDLVLEDVVALAGGIDILMQGGLPVLERNGVPLIGGIPAGLPEQTSEISFQFSGGTAGAFAAMLAHAEENGAERAFIAVGDFESFTTAAREYGIRVGEDLGLEMRLHVFPIIGADFLSVLNDARSFDADAVIMAAADNACVPVMQAFRDLGFDGTLYLVGACAADAILEAADGANAGVVFSSEGPPDPDDVEGTIFDEVSTEYNNGNAQAAGTVAFRGMMNLYSLLVELGPDNATREAVTDLVRRAEDRDSFWGHPYTCDGEQVPGLRSLCAPQQTLFEVRGDSLDDLVYISDWIDTVSLFRSAFAK